MKRKIYRAVGEIFCILYFFNHLGPYSMRNRFGHDYAN